MILWLGIALVQVVALPGYLLTRALGLDRDGPLQTALLSFGLSLLLNHLAVLVLVPLGAHTRGVWCGVLALEVAAWLGLRAAGGGARRRDVLAQRVQDFLAARGPAGACATRRLALLVGALAALAWLAGSLGTSFTHVFVKWDAVLSWNRYAAEWAAGRVPYWVGHYPQLVPTAWSTLYVIQGDALQFLARGMMALFPPALALVFLDLGLRRRAPEPLLAAMLLAVLLATGLGPWLGSGHADVPVALFGLLALYPLDWGPLGDDPPRDRSRLVAATLLGAGAALTKQTGVFVAGLLPLFVWLRLAGRPFGARLRAAAAVGVGIVVLAGPWYGFAEWRIAQGIEPTELPHVTQGVHHGATLPERGRDALGQWAAEISPVGLGALLVLVVVSLADPAIRSRTLLLSLPFPVLWALFASYDLRNSALAIPWVALSAAHGTTWLARRAAPSRPARAGLAAAGVAVLLGIGAWLGRDAHERLAAEQERQALRVGKPELNARLLEHLRTEGFDGRILGNYLQAENLPGMRELFFVNRGAPEHEFWPYRGTKEAFVRTVEDPANDIRYLLVAPPIMSRSVRQHVHAGAASGRYPVIFETRDGALLRVPRPPGD